MRSRVVYGSIYRSITTKDVSIPGCAYIESQPEKTGVYTYLAASTPLDTQTLMQHGLTLISLPNQETTTRISWQIAALMQKAEEATQQAEGYLHYAFALNRAGNVFNMNLLGSLVRTRNLRKEIECWRERMEQSAKEHR